jgi:hypothetical protein
MSPLSTQNDILQEKHTQPESIHAQVSQHMRNDFMIFLRVGMSLADLSEDSLRL